MGKGWVFRGMPVRQNNQVHHRLRTAGEKIDGRAGFFRDRLGYAVITNKPVISKAQNNRDLFLLLLHPLRPLFPLQRVLLVR